MDRAALVNRVNRALDLPMALLSLVMLALVLVDLLAELTPEARLWLERANWAIWSVFALEFVFKLGLSPDKRTYMRTHWFDALVVIVPMFRVLRALRILRVTKAFPLFRLAAFVGMGLRGTRTFMIHYRIGYLLALTGLVTLGAAVGALLLERGEPHTRFVTFGDALWWSAALMTTVGSDLNPQTALGRTLAVGIMLYAQLVFVYLIGALSSELLHKRRPAEPTAQQGLVELEGEEEQPSGDDSRRSGPHHAPRRPRL